MSLLYHMPKNYARSCVLFLFGYFFKKKIKATIAVTIIAMIFEMFKSSAKLFLSFKMYVAQTVVIKIAGRSEIQ